MTEREASHGEGVEQEGMIQSRIGGADEDISRQKCGSTAARSAGRADRATDCYGATGRGSAITERARAGTAVESAPQHDQQGVCELGEEAMAEATRRSEIARRESCCAQRK